MYSLQNPQQIYLPLKDPTQKTHTYKIELRGRINLHSETFKALPEIVPTPGKDNKPAIQSFESSLYRKYFGNSIL